MLESVAVGVLMHLGAVGVFFPVLLTIELPVYLTIILGLTRDRLPPRPADPRPTLPAPTVSCIITCYNEGACVERTVTTLTGRIPDPMQSIFRESDTALMVRIRLDRPVPASMAVHGLPVEVEFDRGITVMLARMDLIPAFASEAPGLH
ncbi:UNVERIFIED_CONTAM: hypothetical protein K0B97_08710 [Spiribacter pallidus]